MENEVPILETRNLRCEFKLRRTSARQFRRPKKIALDDVSLSVMPHKTLGIVGESGAGKTTLAHTLLALRKPDSGDVVFNGQSLLTMSPQSLRALRRQMQIVFQNPGESLNSKHRVGYILEEPLRIHREGNTTARKRRIDKILSLTGLPSDVANRFPHELSGGEQQRIAIARSLVLEPSLLILDEPTASVDVTVQAVILNLLLNLQTELGLTMIFISHDLAVVRHMSDQIAVMQRGKILEQLESTDLLTGASHPYTKNLIEAFA